MFAHPQGPYFQGPLPPPAQYAIPYDPMTQPPYAPGYYTVSSTSFPPNGIPSHGSPMSPPSGPHHTPTPPLTHGRSASELISPVQLPFSPSVPLPSLPYGIASPMSPSYPQPGQMSVPVGIAPLPPLHHSHVPNQQSPPVIYQPTSPGAQGPGPNMGHRRNSSAAYAQGIASSRGPGADVNMLPQSPPPGPQMDSYGPSHGPVHRDTMGHTRRGSMRRTSTVGFPRKPPCLFFPSGRCRNG